MGGVPPAAGPRRWRLASPATAAVVAGLVLALEIAEPATTPTGP